MKQREQVLHLLDEIAFVEAQDYLIPAAQYKESILTNEATGKHSILTFKITDIHYQFRIADLSKLLRHPVLKPQWQLEPFLLLYHLHTQANY